MPDPSHPVTDRASVLMVETAAADDFAASTGLSIVELVRQMPEAHAIVTRAPGDPMPGRVRSVRREGRARLSWLATLARVVREEARSAEVVDMQAAGDAILPLLLGVFRHRSLVVHFDDRPDREPPPRRRMLEHLVYSRASAVVALSGRARQLLVEQHAVSPWRVWVTAPPLGRFVRGDRATARARLSVSPDAFVACYVHAPVLAEEARVLLDAWASFIATACSGSREAILLVAAAGERRGLLSLDVVPSGLAHTVRILGSLDDDRLADLFRAADVNIAAGSSSTASEIALAAAVCGTPSITPDGGDGVHAAANAAIAPPGDAVTLTAGLVHAASGILPTREDTYLWAAQWQRDRVVADLRRIHQHAVREHNGPGRKLRVVYLGHVAQLSGGELALLRLLTALDAIDAHVILAEDGPLIDELHAAGISVEVLPLAERTRKLRKARVGVTRLPIVAALDTLTYVLRLARRIRAIRPDVLHTNSLKAGVYGSLAGRLARIPVVWHLRDRISDDYLNRRSAVMLVRGLIATLPSAVIVNSEATGRTLWRAPGRARVIPSPIRDPIRQQPLRPRAYPETFVVGMIGRIARWKGQHVLIDAVAQAFPDGEEIVLIVGAPMFGEEEAMYEAELRQQAKSRGLADRIVFRGFRSDVWRELVEMDIFVHASTTPEPFGQVIVEAMLAGVPVIAAAAGGPREIITDGVDGLLYEPGDVAALAHALRRLRTEPDLRTRLSEHARRRASDFSPESVAAAVTEVYRAALTRHA